VLSLLSTMSFIELLYHSTCVCNVTNASLYSRHAREEAEKDTSSRSSLTKKSHREEKRSEVKCNGQ